LQPVNGALQVATKRFDTAIPAGPLDASNRERLAKFLPIQLDSEFFESAVLRSIFRANLAEIHLHTLSRETALK
jgi:hypothetical protein